MFKHFFVYYMKDRVGEYLIREKMQKTCKKRAKTCKKRAAKVNLIKKRASQVFLDLIQNRALSRFVQLKAVYLEALLYRLQLCAY